jgi:hypothetical protein
MLRVLSSVSLLVLLGGCASIHDWQTKHGFVAKHESVKLTVPQVAVPIVVPPPVTSAPAAPVTKETFKHRWLKKLFRDRVK